MSYNYKQLSFLKENSTLIKRWILGINDIDNINSDYKQYIYSNRIKKVGNHPYNLYVLFNNIIDYKLNKELYNSQRLNTIFEHVNWTAFRIVFEEYFKLFTKNKSNLKTLLINLYDKKYKIISKLEDNVIDENNNQIDDENDYNVVEIQNSESLPILTINNNTTHIMFSRGDSDESINNNPVYSVMNYLLQNGNSMNEYDFIKLPKKYSLKDRLDMACMVKRNCVKSSKDYSTGECGICMEKTDNVLSCGHGIHVNCMSMTDNTKCPVCNQEVSLDENIERDIYSNRIKNGKDLPMILNIPVTENDNTNKIYVLYQ